MKLSLKKGHSLVIATLVVSLLILCFMFAHQKPSRLMISSQIKQLNPLLGSAQATSEWLLIEDIQSEQCRLFNQTVLEEAKNNFFDTGKAHCTIIPVALLPNSTLPTEAALAVYHTAPSRFFSYLKALHAFTVEHEQAPTIKDLQAIAIQVGEINMTNWSALMNLDFFSKQLLHNLVWLQEKEGEFFSLPLLYIDGIPVIANSLQDILRHLEAPQ